MLIPKILVYTDASFSQTASLGVSCFLIFTNQENHDSGKPFNDLVKTKSFTEKTNIRAKLRSAIFALEATAERLQAIKSINVQVEINLYTDCQAISQLLKRRVRLEASGYKSARKQKVLTNADLYQIFFSLCDRLQPNIHWVKGHSKNSEQSLIQRHFTVIDQMARKELRALVAQRRSR